MKYLIYWIIIRKMIEYIDEKTRVAFANVKKDMMKLQNEVELIKSVLTKGQKNSIKILKSVENVKFKKDLNKKNE